MGFYKKKMNIDVFKVHKYINNHAGMQFWAIA